MESNGLTKALHTHTHTHDGPHIAFVRAEARDGMLRAVSSSMDEPEAFLAGAPVLMAGPSMFTHAVKHKP